MMRAASKAKTVVRSAHKPKSAHPRATKSDSRVREAEKFLLPTYTVSYTHLDVYKRQRRC